ISLVSQLHSFLSHDPPTTEIYTFPYTTLFRSWPPLEAVLTKSLGYFDGKGTTKTVDIPALNEEVKWTCEWHDGAKPDSTLEVKSVPFLRNAQDPHVKISKYNNHVFVLLNIKTEFASELIRPQPYGSISLCSLSHWTKESTKCGL